MSEPMTTPSPPLREALLWTLFAALIRAVYWAATPQVIDSADSILYLDAAEKFLAGANDQVYPRIPLLYPFLGGIASRLTPDVEYGALAVSFIALTLLVPVLFALSHAIHGLSSARFVALITSLWPWLVDYSCRVAPESIYALLWFASAYLALLAIRRGGLFPYALAAVLPLLYLARPEGFIIVAAALLSALFFLRESGAALKRMIPAVCTLAIAVPIHWLYLRHLSETTGVAPRVSSSSMAFLVNDWGSKIAATAFQLLFVAIPVMLGPVLLVLLALGIFWGLKAARDRRAECVVAVLAFAQWCAASLSTFAEPRYVMTTIVALALWSARGAAVVTERLTNSPARTPLRYFPAMVIVLMMCAGLLANIVPPMLGKMSYKPLEYKLAGTWMRDNLEPGLIFSRKPQVGYYANMQTTGPAPEDSLEDIHSRLTDSGAKYLVVDARYSTEMIPALKPLLDSRNAPGWLRVLRDDLSPYAEAPIVVYEVVQ